jgi:hypothetical protein
MTYDNTYWLTNRISTKVAAELLFAGVDVYGIINCGCPKTPDPVKVSQSEVSFRSVEDIEAYIVKRYVSFARIVLN